MTRKTRKSDLLIEPVDLSGYGEVFEYGVYENYRSLRTFVDSFETLKAAKEAFPTAEVSGLAQHLFEEKGA